MKKWSITCMIVLFIIVSGYMALCNEVQKSSEHVSLSIKEAKEDNVFIKKVKIIPSQIFVDGSLIEFNECWVEERTYINYKWLFFKTVKKLGTYFICFNLKNDIPNFCIRELEFKSKNSQYPFASTRSIFFYDRINSLNIKKLKVDLTEKAVKVAEISLVF